MAKWRGKRGTGCATVREWMHPGLSPSRENPPGNNTKDWMMPVLRGEIREVESGKNMRGGTRDRQNPQGITRAWVQTEGVKGGSTLLQEMATYTGTRSGVQG